MNPERPIHGLTDAQLAGAYREVDADDDRAALEAEILYRVGHSFDDSDQGIPNHQADEYVAAFVAEHAGQASRAEVAAVLHGPAVRADAARASLGRPA